MPDISFTLPHWLYWIGLIVFPLMAMALSRGERKPSQSYSAPLAYFILLTGGILGLHRFYLKSLLGLLYLPVFLFILYANGQESEARSVVSDLQNETRTAERTIAREEPRLAEAEASVAELRAGLADVEAGSVQERLAKRRIERAEAAIPQSQERIAEARAALDGIGSSLDDAVADRAFWDSAAGHTFYLILAFMALDALLIPGMVRRANASIANASIKEDTKSEAELALERAEAEEGRKSDAEYAKNWIDRLSLFCGEFVAYWAVIAVFVYYFEVVSRYVFGIPTNWAHEAMYLMFGMQYLISGSYAMLTESHVRVDIFYAPLSKPRKAWVDLFTSIFFFIFAGTLLWTSYVFAMDALAVPTGNGLVSDWARGQIGFGEVIANWNMAQWTDPNVRWGELSFNEWEVPLWPMKWVMVMGGLLLVLQGISKLSKDIRTIARGE